LSLLRKESVLNEFDSFIVDSVVGRLRELTEQVNDQALNLSRAKKGEKDWTDKGNHNDY